MIISSQISASQTLLSRTGPSQGHDCMTHTLYSMSLNLDQNAQSHNHSKHLCLRHLPFVRADHLGGGVEGHLPCSEFHQSLGRYVTCTIQTNTRKSMTIVSKTHICFKITLLCLAAALLPKSAPPTAMINFCLRERGILYHLNTQTPASN